MFLVRSKRNFLRLRARNFQVRYFGALVVKLLRNVVIKRVIYCILRVSNVVILKAAFSQNKLNCVKNKLEYSETLFQKLINFQYEQIASWLTC